MDDYLEFAEIMASGMELSDVEYLSLIDEIEQEELDQEYESDYDEQESEEIESDYELDDSWPDDDWLEAYDEWELSPDYGED